MTFVAHLQMLVLQLYYN